MKAFKSNLNRYHYLFSLLLILCAFTTISATDLQVVRKYVMTFSHAVKIQNNRSLTDQFRQIFKADSSYDWKKTVSETDRKGKVHTRYQQLIAGIPVSNAVIVLHTGGDSPGFITGTFVRVNKLPVSNFNYEAAELAILHKFLPEKSALANDFSNSGWQWLINETDQSVQLGFTINYYPQSSLQGHTVTVDAATLTKIYETHASCYADVTGTAVTAYQGIKTISCSADSGRFYLKSTTRGSGIFTRNLNNQLNYQNITDFTDADNYWQPGSAVDQQYATDAHYCAEKYYDFLAADFNRNSLDNNGYSLTSYLNYGTSMVNAFWNGQAVVYGSGNTSSGPLTTLDIAGHEFTHGLIQKTAGLQYSGAPGIINESLADIFGAALEEYSNPLEANWLIGEQSGTPLRSLSNPGEFNQPAYYHGNFWYYGTGDNGGVHINSGFINKWFYILANGEQGINEIGFSYDVTGIGMTPSIDIIYHTLTSYLLSNSGFDEFRQYTVQSALDLYGNCSPEYDAVLKAWEAVGYGFSNAVPQLIPAGSTNFCNGDSILISLQHQPGSEYEWIHNGVAVFTGADPAFYVSSTGSWQVRVNRCGTLYLSDPISLNRFPVTPVSAQHIEICKGSPVIPGGFPSGGTATIPSPYYGNSTTYLYFYTDSNGCRNSASGSVLVHELPMVDLLNESCLLPQNSSPVLLEGNVPGIFEGIGVTGSYFDPQVAGVGGPYLVRLTYTDSNGCVAADSAHYTVMAPCVKEFKNIAIQVSDSDVQDGQTVLFRVPVSTTDFRFKWKFPEGCTPIGAVDAMNAAVIWNNKEGKALLWLYNTCNDSIQIAFTVRVKTPSSLTVFPNPARDKVTVRWDGMNAQMDTEIRVSDLSGRQVKKMEIVDFSEQITIENLPPGLYLIELQCGTLFLMQTLIVQ